MEWKTFWSVATVIRRPLLLLAVSWGATPGWLAVQAQTTSAKRDTSTFQQVQTVVVDLDQAGFHPAILRCKAGSMVLKVRNGSGRKKVEFRFDKVGGGAAKTQSLTDSKNNYRESITLTAGEYTLTATHDKTLVLKIVAK